MSNSLLSSTAERIMVAGVLRLHADVWLKWKRRSRECWRSLLALHDEPGK